MRRQQRIAEVFTMSAIDLFASAMGAFLIITIILMPDYRKEVMAEGDNTLLERLMAESLDALENQDQRKSEAQRRRDFALQEIDELMAQASLLRNAVEEAEQQLMADFDPPPPPEPAEELSPEDEVSFRFLGLKTDERSFLLLIDLNRFLEPHADLMARSVARTLGSLRDGHEFALLAFNRQDSGNVFLRWPEDGGLVPVGKAYFGFTDAELRQLDKFVRENTVERFGPVRAVKAGPDAGLVLEIAFEGLQRSTRHKSGVAMRFPRISRIRWDQPAVEADRLEALEHLLETHFDPSRKVSTIAD